MKTKEVILSVTMQLTEGAPVTIKATMDDFNGRRRDKQPLEYPSAGSTFKRPEGYFAGKLIQDAGLKGFQLAVHRYQKSMPVLSSTLDRQLHQISGIFAERYKNA